MNNFTDKPTCNCGVFGIIGHDNASLPTYYALHALQHRGQEAAGIISCDKNEKGKTIFKRYKSFGLVSDIFAQKDIFSDKLTGTMAVGHNRYSTAGSSDARKNIQPFTVNYRMGNLAIAHNGNLTNARAIRKDLIEEGSIFQTTSDTEVILHLIAKSKLDNHVDQVRDALKKIEGSYSLIIMTDDKIIAARDPHGFRPLTLGKLNGSFIATSETCALDINLAKEIREVEPGELVVLDQNTITTGDIKSYRIHENNSPSKHCVFEFIYFSRPDSRIFGSNVDKIRRKLGKVLAEHHPVEDPDGKKVVVISVPDSSNTAALGYQNQLIKMGIDSRFEIGLIRSHYVGRTFILPGQTKRDIGVRIKFNIVRGVLENRTVVLVDDSIVRGTTSRQLVKLLKEANPKSIHIRISSPPILNPCHYGMDFPSKEELIANRFGNNIGEIESFLGVDSLRYMTEDELLSAMIDHDREHFCTACFTGKYPIPIHTAYNKEELDD
ncbi:MAG: amidophosphoribosyltransferase [Melioribacteraceae bacterium]|nr:amidophosphoribosyltransferase [Melioribacteraceae bacterium]MCF8264664.1 amidophosphoribosyltransferase [Melioribacteraceae bacterium]MCF8432099.1 amidophosphoribosyltransferase [Melioribacteraceae bacterium]